MKCPNCGRDDMRVQETRDAGETVYRVRKCRDTDCGWLVTTEEKYAEQQSIPMRVRRPSRKKI